MFFCRLATSFIQPDTHAQSKVQLTIVRNYRPSRYDSQRPTDRRPSVCRTVHSQAASTTNFTAVAVNIVANSIAIQPLCRGHKTECSGGAFANKPCRRLARLTLVNRQNSLLHNQRFMLLTMIAHKQRSAELSGHPCVLPSHRYVLFSPPSVVTVLMS